jgi:phage terminase small subunit
MMVPRRPKPIQLKILEGRLSRRELARVPKPQPAVAEAEPWARLSPAERGYYERAFRELLPLGVVGDVDLTTLTLWAKAYARALAAHRDVARRGAIVAGARSAPSGQEPVRSR